MRDSPFDMPAVGRSRLFLLLASLLLCVVAFVTTGGRAFGQTGTTAPTVAASAAPSSTAASAGDEASTRTVNRIVAILVALAVILVGVAIWFWRATKPTPRHLDGLDMMGSRRWREGGAAERAVLLAPVHERRGEADAGEVAAEPEPVEAVAGEVAVAEDAEDASAVEDEPTTRAS